MEGTVLFVGYLYIVLYQIQAIFLYVRLQKMQERNTESQKKNIMPHVCGRKSFSRKRNDIVSNVKLVYYIDINYFTILILYIFMHVTKTIKTGKRPCRVEFFIETRTKPNGSFLCEEAKERAVSFI